MKKTMKHKDVLDFWFTEISSEFWFKKDAHFDKALEARFGKVVADALAGRLDHWANDASGCIALILLLDQFTRNIFRESARAFAGDEMALALSIRSVDRGYIDTSHASHRHFMLMPMMHSEDLAVQNKSLALFQKYTNAKIHNFAVKHRDIIAQFGRFPHRNNSLGRPNTPEEEAFLLQPGSSF